MFENFKRYHMYWLPLHVFLFVAFAMGYGMSGRNDDWIGVGLAFAAIFQLYFIGLIPSFIIFFIKKDKSKSIGAFLASSTFLLIPYLIIFIVMKIVFF